QWAAHSSHSQKCSTCRCNCRARTKGGTADSPGLCKRSVSTKNNLPSLSRRKGLEHWELAHRLNINSPVPIPHRTAESFLPAFRVPSLALMHYRRQSAFRGLAPRLDPLSCRLIGTKCRWLVAAFLLASRLPATILFMRKVLVCPPDYFDVVDQKNPYMTQDAAVDVPEARGQWDALCSALQQCGCEVETIEPVAGLEDMVFAANQVFVGARNGYGRFVVPSRMVYASRQREVLYFVDWCRRRDYKIIDLNLGDDYLEGHGDPLWHPD